MKPTNKKPKITRINKATIRSLGGCNNALKIFDVYAQGEDNPTLDSIYKRIAEGQWSTDAEDAITWLQEQNLLPTKNLVEILKRINERNITISISFWEKLLKIDAKTSTIIRAEMINLLTRLLNVIETYTYFMSYSRMGNFVSLIGDEAVVEKLIGKLLRVTKIKYWSNEDEFWVGFIIGLLSFKEISETEVKKRYLSMEKLMPKTKNKLKKFIYYGRWTHHYRNVAEVDWEKTLKKLNSPIISKHIVLNADIRKMIIRDATKYEEYNKSFLSKLQAIMGDKIRKNAELADVLVNNVLTKNFNDTSIEFLADIKEYFGPQVNIIDLNWKQIYPTKTLWRKTSVNTLKELIVADALSFQRNIDTETIGTLINSYDEGQNYLGEILLNATYDCAERTKIRNEIVNDAWLNRISQKKHLTAVEKATIRNINPTRWLDLIAMRWRHTGRKVLETNAELLSKYPPNKLPEKYEMTKYNRKFYEYVKDTGSIKFISELIRQGYTPPELTKTRIENLSAIRRCFTEDELSSTLHMMERLLYKLPLQRKCTFPVGIVKYLSGYGCSDLFEILIFKVLLKRGVAIDKNDMEDYSIGLKNLIQDGYLYFWRYFEKLPPSLLTNRTIDMIGDYKDPSILKNKHGKKLMDVVGNLIKEDAYKYDEDLLKAYVYLGIAGTINDNKAIKKFGKAKYLLAKHSYLKDIPNWRRYAKAAGLDLSEYAREIFRVFTSLNTSFDKETVFCIEDILQELLDREDEEIDHFEDNIVWSCRKIHRTKYFSKKHQELWFKLAERYRNIADSSVLGFLSQEQQKKIMGKWELNEISIRIVRQRIKRSYSRF